VHQLTSVKKASYRFLDKFVAVITQEGDAWVCELNFVQPVSPEGANALIRDLHAEVLDQGLRETIAAETAAVRNTVLALAFSRTGLQSGE